METMNETSTNQYVEMDIYNEEEENTQKGRYLLFSLGNETYAIEIEYITEIVVLQDIIKVPNLPGFIEGVINLRGSVISVMNMRSRFQMDEKRFDDRTCIIVINVNDFMIGLIVDTVNEVLEIPEQKICPPPRHHSGDHHNFIQGLGKVGGEVKIILDVNRILKEEEQKQVEMAS